MIYHNTLEVRQHSCSLAPVFHGEAHTSISYKLRWDVINQSVNRSIQTNVAASTLSPGA